MYEINWWQSIYIKYKEHNITNTNVNTINKNKIIIILTNNTGNCSNSQLTTNNKTMTTTIKQQQLDT